MRQYLALAAALCIGTAAHAAPADYVFRNARVYTVNDQQPWAEAVAVQGKHIVYVGKDDDSGLKPFVGRLRLI